MKKILVEKVPRITKNRKRLEEKLNVKIENRGKEFFITGEAEDEFVAVRIIEALDIGFPYSVAMLIIDEDFMMEVINIKEQTSRKDFARIRARVIGRGGKALKTLSNLTQCYLELKDNTIGIIGEPEYIKTAEEAIGLLICGSKHANVYAYLEKHQVRPVVDLGLKEEN